MVSSFKDIQDDLNNTKTLMFNSIAEAKERDQGYVETSRNRKFST